MQLTINRVTGARVVARAATFAAAGLIGASAHAAYLLDTGTQDGGTNNWSLFNSSGDDLQFLAAGFTVGSATTITSVEGWIATNAPGDVIVSLYSGAPTVAASPLFSTTLHLDQSTGHEWETFGGLSWAVGAGDYSVAFSTATGYGGTMVDGAPLPAPSYYFYSPDNGEWVSFNLAMGVRVAAAVPEPASFALLLAGLAGVGWAARRRAC